MWFRGTLSPKNRFVTVWKGMIRILLKIPYFSSNVNIVIVIGAIEINGVAKKCQ